jgi:class 3 adenylate cyclase
MSTTEWSELAVSELPTGTVTLLLADVEGSTRLWETQPKKMTAAIAQLDATLADLIAVHGGVRPVEQGEGDSFVLAFARASDAVACALALQRAPLAPNGLRIGLNTGEIQLRDEGNYIGPTINRTARLRIWRMVARRCCRVRQSRWCSTIFRMMLGSTILAAIRCAI